MELRRENFTFSIIFFPVEPRVRERERKVLETIRQIIDSAKAQYFPSLFLFFSHKHTHSLQRLNRTVNHVGSIFTVVFDVFVETWAVNGLNAKLISIDYF